MSDNTKGRISLLISRILVYAFLAMITVLCLFSFYMLIINSSRSNAQLQAGFTLVPGGHFLDNLRNAWTDASIDIPRGMRNSLIIAVCTSALTTYFSAMTAYGVHVYDFKGKNLVFNLGFTHPVEVAPADGIEFEVPNQNQVIVKGLDKHLVGQVAANIRAIKSPEPYKGKGIRYTDEHVVIKEGKSGM